MKRLFAIALCAVALAWAPIAQAQQVSNTRLDLILNDVATTQAENATYWHGGRGTFMVESGAWGGGSHAATPGAGGAGGLGGGGGGGGGASQNGAASGAGGNGGAGYAIVIEFF